ncbi:MULTISPECIES: class I SAM-dependent methyltransferase [Agrobacterium]|uniref:Class I SAM-dependent methyltransferase n=1 Tax=Agrobacterium tumefaciens TaxID=358 RepID=A0AAE6BA49_AGRTU|nr:MULTISPECIES: class I SAM-dependent methyltransferase [Agrobacterium]QCL72621.1 class I SAM-dependent methyltransferase [Agrobacterium tumefaciens]QCL78193.1 class I SAM-dependent methyltransferase [Agrobacterium tumefaciens]CUX16894.1 Methyltransferase [Agrobacterium sp. NCPPB 925]
MSDASRDVIKLYTVHGGDFDSARGRSLAEKPWLDRFTSLLPDGGSILDIGCGSGEPIAGYFIAKGYDVTGIDASLPLIELCRSRFPENLWGAVDMRELALGSRFDGLIAWHSFFHLKPEDQRLMFGIFRQHANDGAALMFTAGPGHGEAIGTFQGKPLYHASLAREDYESLLAAHGFRLLDHIVNDPQCGGATIYLARRVA